MNISEVVQYLENLTIMPKTMPGLEKMRSAVHEKKWFLALDPKKIITVAGTNGKGTTCAVLEALLLAAGQKVGLYTSPHLVQTTERIRVSGLDISESDFCNLFLSNKKLIEKHQLSHFEALTLMAADWFFTQELNFVIFEVGLGGTYDATNIFPNQYSIITKLGFDHQNILGFTIQDIAKNKFGIVKEGSVVVHHELPIEALALKNLSADWISAKAVTSLFKENTWWIDSPWGRAEINMAGERSVENAAMALTMFDVLGFDPKTYLGALNQIRWPGRMQKIIWPGILAPTYLSGDHNHQGIMSLVEILKKYTWSQLHLIVGIGQDKACEEMFKELLQLPNVSLYLTVTPFKGRAIDDYPDWVLKLAVQKNKNIFEILGAISTNATDLVVMTGSLYLVGEVLKQLRKISSENQCE